MVTKSKRGSAARFLSISVAVTTICSFSAKRCAVDLTIAKASGNISVNFCSYTSWISFSNLSTSLYIFSRFSIGVPSMEAFSSAIRFFLSLTASCSASINAKLRARSSSCESASIVSYAALILSTYGCMARISFCALLPNSFVITSKKFISCLLLINFFIRTKIVPCTYYRPSFLRISFGMAFLCTKTSFVLYCMNASLIYQIPL